MQLLDGRHTISDTVIRDDATTPQVSLTHSSSDKYIQAIGTTLNGVSFAGETVDGAAELAPFYRIVSFESGIQF